MSPSLRTPQLHLPALPSPSLQNPLQHLPALPTRPLRRPQRHPTALMSQSLRIRPLPPLHPLFPQAAEKHPSGQGSLQHSLLPDPRYLHQTQLPAPLQPGCNLLPRVPLLFPSFLPSELLQSPLSFLPSELLQLLLLFLQLELLQLLLSFPLSEILQSLLSFLPSNILRHFLKSGPNPPGSLMPAQYRELFRLPACRTAAWQQSGLQVLYPFS